MGRAARGRAMGQQDMGGLPPRLPPDSPYMGPIREAKAHAARMRGDPGGCPTFPDINRSCGAAEALCYMQGYLAGRIEAAGLSPTRAEMRAARHDVMHDDAVREIVVGMQDETLLRPEDPPSPRDY